ncbi:MAG: hypothetical protein CFE34_09310 [Rhodobacteraceae bacterium PARR1]|nr:MAG: hypothetical protein CFE34_09310 [Rhodobacteraceae bacterium PARR1]
MSDDTPILSLPLILPAQAQKHVTHNEALRILDVLVQLAVTDRTRATPPAAPVEGDRHIIATGATGPWSDRDGQVACYWGGAWLYLIPQDGWTARVLTESRTVAWQGGEWVNAVTAPPPPVTLGINATADTTNRLTVSAPATLLTHEGAGHQVKINKALPADTASLLFQSGWQGRAEMGLAGNDAFAVKVSADDGQWRTALTTDPASGSLSLPAPLRLGAQTTAPVSPANGTLWLDPTGEVRVASSGTVQRVGLADGSRGDITVSANGMQWTVAPGSIGNTKLAAITGPALKGRSTAGSGATDDLTPAQARAMMDLAPLSHTDFCEVARLGSPAAIVGPFAATAVLSGTYTTTVPATSLLGINPFGVFCRSSANANSGYRFSTNLTCDFFGVTTRKFRAKCLWRGTTGTTVRLGYHNCTTVADSNNGAYFEVVGDQIAAKTAAASVRTAHPTVLTLTSNTLYTFDIEADAPATTIRFRVWENINPTPVFDVSIQTNLPTTSANAFGAGVIATNSQVVASDLLILYEIIVGTTAGFRRLLD